MFTRLKFRVGSGPRILSLRVYDRKLFISFHVQAVVPLMLVKPTDTSPLASANISPLTNIPTSLRTWKVLKTASVALFSSMCSVFCGRLISLIKSFFYLGLWTVNHGKKGESEEMEWEKYTTTSFTFFKRISFWILSGAMMAATIFALRNLCLILLLCSGFLSLFHQVVTARERA